MAPLQRPAAEHAHTHTHAHAHTQARKHSRAGVTSSPVIRLPRLSQGGRLRSGSLPGRAAPDAQLPRRRERVSVLCRFPRNTNQFQIKYANQLHHVVQRNSGRERDRAAQVPREEPKRLELCSLVPKAPLQTLNRPNVEQKNIL